MLKGYQQLVDEQLVEKRRGLGMYVSLGAAATLRTDERQRFLEHDWPKVRASIARLGLDLEQLLHSPTPPAANKDEEDDHDR